MYVPRAHLRKSTLTLRPHYYYYFQTEVQTAEKGRREGGCWGVGVGEWGGGGRVGFFFGGGVE